MLKLSENPPCLCPWVENVTDLEGTWWVAHTKSRNEKALAFDFLRGGIGYFLPLYEKRRVSGRRMRRVLLPLFPSYVFFCGDGEARYFAMTTNRLCQTIRVVDQEELVRELSHLQRAVAGMADLDPFPEVAVGKRCRITAGPFRDVEGIVVRRNGATHVVLRVSMLARGALMRIDPSFLEVLD